jgi:GxxExxY protein
MIATKPIVYPKLSYQLMSVFFSVHNQLGNELQEKYYQRAVEDGLRLKHIPFQTQVYIPIQSRYGQHGNYFLDFIINNKIALELKAQPTIYGKDIRQLLAYLSITKLRLGIIANFRTLRLTYKRLINAQLKSLADDSLIRAHS